ncbi:U-box domain-containing protein 6-like isoform X1 [Zea mays]|uniref:RING-type E3 ubiquitin transferase n=1 Tax=Zea mays TaxID=4577 RepID=A0A1D6E7T6_MAIZE|nr:uncharacterized protein LOC100279391 isoform X1 [Zea mays]ONM16485.1 U-box domain-containing protein 7 [Zea mays]|eukprot:XP_008667778.1 uncharacterized protein LOC100279391 isoform X1 [Zea mays]
MERLEVDGDFIAAGNWKAVTAESVLTKFENSRQGLLESLHQVEETIPEAVGSKITMIAQELEKAGFVLDQSEKQVGDEVSELIQNEPKSNGFLDENELEFLHQIAFRVGITSSVAALTERRALRRLLERAHAEEDLKKESIAAYLLHLIRKYSNIFKSETNDSTNSLCSSPSCSSSKLSSSTDLHGNCQILEKRLPSVGSLSPKQIGGLSGTGSMPLPPEELRCPISLQLMYDPVVIASGQTYERACIEKWFHSGNTTCPKTRKQLSQLLRTPNYCIKGLIASWCEQNGVPVPAGPPESPKLEHLSISSLESTTCAATDGANTNTVLFEDTTAKDDAKSESEVSKEMFSRQNSGEATSKLRIHEEVSPENCSALQSSKEAAPDACGVEDSVDVEKGKGSHQDSKDDVPVSERCEQWLHVLNKNDAESMSEKHKLVEQIRILLKNDDELRNYAGANGITEPLIHFLKMAIHRGGVQSQEVATMALFNLAVNNDGNKRLLLSAGVIPLMEQMIQKHETCEAAIAMYLNLSCIPEAQAIIGSSVAIHFLVNSLGEGGPRSDTCRMDALLTLYNLSLHAPNIPPLMASGIIENLRRVLVPSSPWTDKALAVLLNLALTRRGKEEIAASAAMVGAIVLIVDNGEPGEKEKAVSCLYVICSGDEGSSQTVLQEGVIPALVSVTANGTARARDKAQRLLRLFREQRQRELELEEMQPRVELHEVASRAAVQQQREEEEEEMALAVLPAAAPSKPSGGGKKPRLCRSGSRRFTKVFTCLLKKWSLR